MRIISLEVYDFYLDVWEFDNVIKTVVKFKPKSMEDLKVEYLMFETKKEKDMPSWQQSLLDMMRISYKQENNEITKEAIKARNVLKKLKKLGIYE
jgi:hypothetical protein